jgi:hypothetical protein
MCLVAHRLVGLVLVESAPDNGGQVERPFDYKMALDTRKPTANLGVSLEQLLSDRLFSVYECFGELMNNLDMDDDEEIIAFKNLVFFRSGGAREYGTWKLEEEIRFSTWSLSARQWRMNLDLIKLSFSRRRYAALARPGMSTYLPMIHLRRRLIVGMRDHLPAAGEHSAVLDRNFEAETTRGLFRPSTLSKTLKEIFDELNQLDRELNDEIHLIIGAVTVQDSDANKQQSERATLLTLLAAVYLPLTLVTGIFGMNIKDINDGSPSWRACGIVLAVVAACTIVFVLAYREWRRWRRGRQERKRMELGFRKDV